jgi:hypothetical protein
MKIFHQFIFFLSIAILLSACAQVAPVQLTPDYIAKHATKEVPEAPSHRIVSNTNIIQSGI